MTQAQALGMLTSSRAAEIAIRTAAETYAAGAFGHRDNCRAWGLCASIRDMVRRHKATGAFVDELMQVERLEKETT